MQCLCECVCSKHTVVLSKPRFLTHKVPSCFPRLCCTHSRSHSFWNLSWLLYSRPTKSYCSLKPCQTKKNNNAKLNAVVLFFCAHHQSSLSWVKNLSFLGKRLEIVCSHSKRVNVIHSIFQWPLLTVQKVIKLSYNTSHTLCCHRNSLWCRDMEANGRMTYIPQK